MFIGDIHLGDWGTPMGMIIHKIKQEKPHLPYFDSKHTESYPKDSPVTMADLERIYPQAAQECKLDEEQMKAAREATEKLQKGDPGYRALWKHFLDVSIKSFKENYHNLDVSFDLWWGESNCQKQIPEMIQKLVEKRIAQKDQGALIIFVDPMKGRDETPTSLFCKNQMVHRYMEKQQIWQP